MPPAYWRPVKTLSEDRRKELDHLFSRYPTRQAAMLPVLYLMQEEYGSLTDDAIHHAAELLDVSPAKVRGVASFYTLFRMPWEGRHTIWVCSTLSCALRGSERVFDHLKETLGVRAGGTTKDGFCTLKKQECLGACDYAPVVQLDDEYLLNVTPESIDRAIENLRRREKP